uniref:Uncharacterized protein n=1 Tax=Anguilla anguilla TaxID=7936 RepID=A0A0E9UQH0_ANGAN
MLGFLSVGGFFEAIHRYECVSECVSEW